MNAEWMLLPERLAVHLTTRTAVAADLHLGYAEARRRCGDAIPAGTTADPWLPIADARKRFAFDRLVVAGDMFERAVDLELAERFRAFLLSIDVTLSAIVPGNHDRGWRKHEDRLPFAPDGVELGEWLVAHDAPDDSRPVIQGHHHPAWPLRGRRVPCFVASAKRIVLPAFSLDAAGGSVASNPRWFGCRAYACDGDAVQDMGAIGSITNRRPRRLLGRTRR
ncbi:MAG: metallophosphoesterase [Gemmataceae bacterium]|nr:metallophosphoesterase [Gemmataceae bacterium]